MMVAVWYGSNCYQTLDGDPGHYYYWNHAGKNQMVASILKNAIFLLTCCFLFEASTAATAA